MPTKAFNDIVYSSEKDLWTLESKIYYILDWEWDRVGFDSEKNLLKLNEKLSFYRLWLSNYLLESEDNAYLQWLQEELKSKWVELLWSFERNGKNYLILYKPEIEWWITVHLLEECKVRALNTL